MRGKHERKEAQIRAARITPADAGKTYVRKKIRRDVEDHPRGCGENDGYTIDIVTAAGSPPRMRGKHGTYGRKRQQRRITPAGAGKTCLEGCFRQRHWDHPRRCGENEGVYLFAPPKRGSPPQVRGKHNGLPMATIATRITPAGAGKTKTPYRTAGKEQDHPRRCGENASEDLSELATAGSPPQVRGKRRR